MPERHFLVIPQCLSPATAALTVALAAWALPSQAEGLDVTAVLASDKVDRGLSQSRGQAALLVDVNGRTDTGWAASLGLATLAPGVEWRSSVSRAWQLDTAAALQIGVEHYGYAGAGGRLQAYDELFASLVWDGRILASVAASPDVRYGAPHDAGSGWAVAYELGWRQPLTASLTADAGIGYDDLRRVARAGYAYGSVGLSWSVAAALQLHVTHVASNAAARGLVPSEIAGQRWIASLVWAF